ncbi:MAG TPA: SDR family oxidoreductase [Anaerolineae bacterium]|nr:SDR family oxidoreductase [Anaerolineae bacterium]
MDIHNKFALVTGGAHRVGQAIALALARSGVHVAITYRLSVEAAHATVDQIKAMGVRSIALHCDQRNFTEIQSLFVSLQREFDHLDILINSAALMERKTVLDVTPDDFDRTIETNLRGPFFIAQAAAKWMKQSGVAGSIVNIADLSAIHPWPSYIAHTISKSGIVAMTHTLALALAPLIRVNAVAPGAIMKPVDWDDARWSKLAGTLPLQRTGSAEDAANAVLFCVQSEFMTGETIVIDGGRSLK